MMMRKAALVVLTLMVIVDAANPGKKRVRDEPSNDSDGDSDVDKDEHNFELCAPSACAPSACAPFSTSPPTAMENNFI